MVLLTSSVLNLLILVLILSASGQNWCFWLFTVGLLFFFFFPVKLFFPDTHIWITSSEPSLLASTPAPTPHALHICMHQGLVLDYRMSSPWVIQLTPLALLTIMSVPVTPNCLLSQIFSGSHTYTKLIINESMMFFLLFYHLILTTMLRSHLIIYSLFSFYE